MLGGTGVSVPTVTQNSQRREEGKEESILGSSARTCFGCVSFTLLPNFKDHVDHGALKKGKRILGKGQNSDDMPM